MLATIDWADPMDPRAVPLDLRGSRFLLDTRGGLQIWDAATLKTTPLQHPWSRARLQDAVWRFVPSGTDWGTLFAVTNGQDASLLWLGRDSDRPQHSLDLPAGFMPSALVELARDAALLCSSSAKRALVVELVGKELRLAGASALSMRYQRELRAAQVRGTVDGLGAITDSPASGDQQPQPALSFETSACAWKANYLPEPLASGQELDLAVRLLPSFRQYSIVAARWLDPHTHLSRTLDVPLVWSAEDRQWSRRQASDLASLQPQRLAGMLHDQGTYASSPEQGRFAFLDQTEDRWREATRRLPPHGDLKLLPIGNEGVLALLIDANAPGRVVRLDPVALDLGHRLNLGSFSGLIALDGGAALLPGKSSFQLLRPSAPMLETLPGLPQARAGISGAQLRDGSVVVFGGAMANCHPAYMHQCTGRSLPGFRWIAQEQRWQPLPELTIPYASGESLGSDWPYYERTDFLVSQGDTLYYLSGEEPRKADADAVATRLYRWQLDSEPKALAHLQSSRLGASLIELHDGRLAVIGGSAANEPPSPACRLCQQARGAAIARQLEQRARAQAQQSGAPDDEPDADQLEAAFPPCQPCAARDGHDGFRSARSCELYDPRGNRWSLGPHANHDGGRAVKLANGRIFKLTLQAHQGQDAIYAAETADAALTQWAEAPPFPLTGPARVRNLTAVDNRVLVVLEMPSDRYVVWDDDTRRWQVHPLPPGSFWSLREPPVFFGPGGPGHVLLVHPRSFEYSPWPVH